MLFLCSKFRAISISPQKAGALNRTVRIRITDKITTRSYVIASLVWLSRFATFSRNFSTSSASLSTSCVSSVFLDFDCSAAGAFDFSFVMFPCEDGFCFDMKTTSEEFRPNDLLRKRRISKCRRTAEGTPASHV
ncbi:hypothetical protein QR680_014736 [Steinernema hermaphroditum]|uniref:Uncharacterized protein n=1 Tax=Steinernema hermaphroditum TaxID=289476 RepID=A0AA39IC79_9BILA|nr:hypothetical protein QR680_014736 [Steinernema hermaphroditum]